MGREQDVEPGTMAITTDSLPGDPTLFLEIEATFGEAAGRTELWLTVARREGEAETLVAALPCYATSPDDESVRLAEEINLVAPGSRAIAPLLAGSYVARIASGPRVLAQDSFEICQS
jgi:hypothetical protein